MNPATSDLKEGQTAIGTRVSNASLRDNDSDTPITKRQDYLCELAIQMGNAAIWVGVAGLLAIIFSFLPDGALDHNHNDTAGPRTIACIAIVFGAIFVIGLPITGALMMLLTKHVFVGTVRSKIIHHEASWSFLRHYAYFFQVNIVFRQYCHQAFAGTVFEVMLYRLLGCKIGSNVYLDNPSVFEYDLVSIGDHSSIGRQAGLSPHNVCMSRTEMALVRVGERCTVGPCSNIHGRDVLADNTCLLAQSTAMIGSNMTSGTWAGYPARNIGPAFAPKQPPHPIWYVILQHPCSIPYALYWTIAMRLGTQMKCPARYCTIGRKIAADDTTRDDVDTEFPQLLRGVYRNEASGLVLRLDAGAWTDILRSLTLKAGTYMTTSGDVINNDPWWQHASYDWDFNFGAEPIAIGRVTLGYWQIPMSIVTASLRSERGGLVLGHSWFSGDPVDEILFQR